MTDQSWATGPEVPEQEPTTNRQRRKLALVVAAIAVLVVGVVVLVVGLSLSSSADADRSDAQSAVEDAQGDRDAANEQLDTAKQDLDSAVASAGATVERTQEALGIAQQLCDCEGNLSDILGRSEAAVQAGDVGAFNAVNAELNAESDRANDLLDQLRTAVG